MYRVRILLFLLLLACVPLSLYGQAETEPVLIGELETFPCSEFRGLTDQFLSDLANHAETYGYVVNSGPRSKRSSLVWREELILSQLEFRNFDRSRIKFELEESVGDVRTRYWRVSNSGPKPTVATMVNPLSLSDISKPFKLTEQTFFNDSECPDVNYSRMFARFLDSNPQSRGNLVVYGRSRSVLVKRENLVVRALTARGIARKRIRVFRRLIPDELAHAKGVEYWFLP